MPLHDEALLRMGCRMKAGDGTVDNRELPVSKIRFSNVLAYGGRNKIFSYRKKWKGQQTPEEGRSKSFSNL